MPRMTTLRFQTAATELQRIYGAVQGLDEFQEMFNARDEVIDRYQKIFSLNNLPLLTKADFTSFLSFENNKHWKPIYRQQEAITSDMDSLRKALLFLVDEVRPIGERLELLRPKGKDPWIKGLSRAIITPILLVMYPDKYGVWNGTSENGMKLLNVFPKFDRGASFSDKFVTINEILCELSSYLKLDLWTLDGLWWGVKNFAEERTSISAVPVPAVASHADIPEISFGMERYLQEFLDDNWDNIPQFKGWKLFEDEDEVVGVEYDTGEVGRIDILAKHVSDPRWLVIELKRDQVSDETMGQLQRYMGWVESNLASQEESIEGVIIGRSIDTKLNYALRVSKDIKFLKYNVSFELSGDE